MRAIYDTIYKDLLEKILDGTYPYQEFIPPESELVKTYDCSHNTVRRALALLAQRGYVQPINGRGVRVIWGPHERADFSVGGIETFKEAATRNFSTFETRIPVFEQLECNQALSEESGFAVGTPLTYMERVRVIEGQAQILDRNFFSAELLPGLTPEIATNSVFEYIEKDLGMRVATSKRIITAERATRTDFDYLDLGDFDFVCVITSQTYNSDGLLFEYTQSRHRPDCFAFRTVAQREA